MNKSSFELQAVDNVLTFSDVEDIFGCTVEIGRCSLDGGTTLPASGELSTVSNSPQSIIFGIFC